ncbi:hypothetical protein BAU07_01030 [Bordetella flabilis]|uniref:DUF2242 domain-containing protein n=2 Tax=Bordetella flabilis TaxID=463014 RepID=A0A193G7U2_9BORD|nr:hypothetical protein BAU07_01030 [Bordetella flabilis]
MLAGIVTVAFSLLVLAGCAGNRPPAYPETFSDTSTYSRTYPATDKATCEAARRALLSQGYTIAKAQADGVEGQKNFQVEEDKHQVISFHVTCTSDHQASPNTSVFVSAVQDRYIIKKVSSSAGVGLSVLGSVSMPFGSSDDSLAKISSETISSPSFYEGFFDLIQRYLPKNAPADAGSGSRAPGTPAKVPPAAATPPASSAGPAPASGAQSDAPAAASQPSGAPGTSGAPAASTPGPTPPPAPTSAPASTSTPASTPSSAPSAPAVPPAPADAGSPAAAGQNAAEPQSAPSPDK